ncbi:unnamed protein product [Gulo gulo]|uniref:Uncharacterized protein n=1 Tax=Gulo gulo TaxID=48420 RepID=A0A9X9LTC8_GULGU|nr:unnamed protein product [Gulo gulo]
MGSPCASRIYFPGPEFTPAAAAAFGISGAPEQGSRHAAPSPAAAGEPWDLRLRSGSAPLARPPVLRRTRRRPKTQSAVHRPEVTCGLWADHRRNWLPRRRLLEQGKTSQPEKRPVGK